jgi:hypothetical protein
MLQLLCLALAVLGQTESLVTTSEAVSVPTTVPRETVPISTTTRREEIVSIPSIRPSAPVQQQTPVQQRNPIPPPAQQIQPVQRVVERRPQQAAPVRVVQRPTQPIAQVVAQQPVQPAQPVQPVEPVQPIPSATIAKEPTLSAATETIVNSIVPPPIQPNSSIQKEQPAQQSQSSSNSSSIYIVAGVIGVVVVAVGGFVARRRVFGSKTDQVRSLEESATTKPRDLSLERFSQVPPLAPLRHSTLDYPKSPKEVLESLHRPVVGLQALEPRSPTSMASRATFYSEIDYKQAAVSMPVQRESIAYSDATSNFGDDVFRPTTFIADDFLLESSGEPTYGNLSYQGSSLIDMMNSDDAAFAVAVAASAHASQDSHSDKYDSMLFSDYGSEYSQE